MLRLIAAALAGLALASAPGQAHTPQHRSHAVAREFEREHPCPATGGACPGWVKDHVVPLACGGPDAVANLQWQTAADAAAKDKWERRGCGGEPR